MASPELTLYRSLLRELRKSLAPPRRVNPTIAAHFRSLVHRYARDNDQVVRRDLENARDFLRAQREHKALLERYNPLFDLTAEERIKATARRVGLDMPVVNKPE